MGSSLTYYGMRSDLLGDSAFNLANVSQEVYIDLMLLKRYKDYLPNLREIIIPVSYQGFYTNHLEDTQEWFRIIQYKRRMGITEHSDMSRYNFEIANFEAYRGALSNYIIPVTLNKCDSLGNGLGYSMKNRKPKWKDMASARMESCTYPDYKDKTEQEADFEALLEYCRDNGIQCHIIFFPVWEGFLEILDKGQISDTRQRLMKLHKAYGVPVYDYLDDKEFNENDFYDSDHLNDEGACKLTRRFISDKIKQ